MKKIIFVFIMFIPFLLAEDISYKSKYDFYSNEENIIFFLINEERGKRGLPYLASFESVAKAANERAKELAVNFSNTRPNGKNYTSLLDEYGIFYIKSEEIIDKGRNNFTDILDNWIKNSQSIVLSVRYAYIGVGYFKDGTNTEYYALIFLSDRY